jgi:N-acetylglutamate synthase-like GNAT family acetyltransferase
VTAGCELVVEMDLILREVTEGDMSGAVALLHAAFGEDMLKQIDHGRTVVALVGAELVGCVAYEPSDEHVYLGRIAVSQPYRHHGVGAALLSHVEASARQLGTPRVRLAVAARETHLREWYEHAGYVLVEECFFPGFEEPTYVMLEKNLGGKTSITT